MGSEIVCTVRFQEQISEGKAYLESEKLTFRGAFKLNIPISDIKRVEAMDGVLEVTTKGGLACFELGPQAEKWAHKIKNPRSLLDKLGVKPEQRISVQGVEDEGFMEQLAARAGTLHVGRMGKESDIVFLGVESPQELKKLATARKSIKNNGAIWIIRPKGKASKFADMDVMNAARSHGLTDVKVAKFSETHTAEKLVIPVAKR